MTGAINNITPPSYHARSPIFYVVSWLPLQRGVRACARGLRKHQNSIDLQYAQVHLVCFLLVCELLRGTATRE